MAQYKSTTQSAATMTLSETELGWNPSRYEAHTLSYHGGGANTATVYGYPLGTSTQKIEIITLENQDGITVPTDSGPWGKFEISFSDAAGTTATVYMTSKSSSAAGDR